MISQGAPEADPQVQALASPDKLPRKEAETLGAAFKQLWADSNPTLVTRAVDPKTRQIVYGLTAEGEAAIKEGELDRKQIFPRQIVRPQKVPITGQGYASTEQHYIYGYKRRDTSYAYLGNK